MPTIAERNLLSDQILAPVGNGAGQLLNVEITGFLSMKGDNYNCELMVVGRSVNGWTTGILPNQLNNNHIRNQYADTVCQASMDGNQCPMLWVAHGWGAQPPVYNTRRSAFWRVIRQVVDGLGIANMNNPDWPSSLLWSNLYKIAPAAGGNPGGTLQGLQQQGCIELLDLEITTYRPERILFLTGINWARPFIAAHHGGGINPPNQAVHVQAHGNAVNAMGHQYRFVVASHPQGKPEAAWVHEVLQVL